MIIYLDESQLGVNVSIGDMYRSLSYDKKHILIYYLPNIKTIKVDQTAKLLTMTFYNNDETFVGEATDFIIKTLKNHYLKRLNAFGDTKQSKGDENNE